MAGWWMDPDVLQALGFWGGGAATVIGALWVAYKHFAARSAPSAKPEPTIQARHGIAAGGKVSVRGNVSISAVPKVAWAVLALGVLGMTAAALFGGNTTITNGAQVGGDMNNSRIEIGR